MLMSYSLHHQLFYAGETHGSLDDGLQVNNLPRPPLHAAADYGCPGDRCPVPERQPSRVSSDDLRVSERDDSERSVSASRRLTVPQTLRSARHSHLASAASRDS
ncbi:MAG: hypothetical protein OXC62_01470 [Aestuariivita sp.]|nr:hypothetical protein [Aestuariivita sp.]